MKKIMIVGGGGRESAMAHAVLVAEKDANIFVAGGSLGNFSGNIVALPFLSGDMESCKQFVKQECPDFVLIGPEAPLVFGLSDYVRALGVPCFGVSSQGARLESDKAFAKKWMSKFGIPTSPFCVLEDYESGKKYLREKRDYPCVLKANGLAGGKGVFVCESKEMAFSALNKLMREKQFGDSGSSVVVEDFISGKEMSAFILFDGKDYKICPPVCDYKKLLDWGFGPNTGGMGAVVSGTAIEFAERIKKNVLDRVVEGLCRLDLDYRGVLYVGLIVSDSGEPFVLEFNVRLGDPETQALLPLLNTSLLDLTMALETGSLCNFSLDWKKEHSACVVICSQGYPYKPRIGQTIHGLDFFDDEVLLFHAGTQRVNDSWIVSGGRVLNVVALDSYSLTNARNRVYEKIRKIFFEDMFFRFDVGYSGCFPG